MIPPAVTVVVLNWHGGADTAQCLISLSAMSYANFRVVVVDNASTDDSVVVIEKQIQSLPRLKHTSHFEKRDLSAGTSDALAKQPLLASYTLMLSPVNGGFAAGNNHGIRAALADTDCQYLWILNNDVEVDANALSALVKRAQKSPCCSVGSVLVYHDTRATVQCVGGVNFNLGRAIGDQNGQGLHWAPGVRFDEPKDLSYIAGASMLIRTEVVRNGGLMAERYFLYFEEIDWAMQLKSFGPIGVATDSIVFHKEGGSIGTSSRGKRSTASQYYLSRNLILFYRQHHWPRLPVALLRNMRESVRCIRLRDWALAKTIVQATLDGLRGLDGKKK